MSIKICIPNIRNCRSMHMTQNNGFSKSLKYLNVRSLTADLEVCSLQVAAHIRGT